MMVTMALLNADILFSSNWVIAWIEAIVTYVLSPNNQANIRISLVGSAP